MQVSSDYLDDLQHSAELTCHYLPLPGKIIFAHNFVFEQQIDRDNEKHGKTLNKSSKNAST